MSLEVMVAPQLLEAAVSDLAAIGSAVDAANEATKNVTLNMPPAAADEVSTTITNLFSQYAVDYQQLASYTDAFYKRLTQQLTTSAQSYIGAETANTALLLPNSAESALAIGNATLPWESFSNATHNYIISLLDELLSVLLWPFWLPIALALLPFYVLFGTLFPKSFPLTDIWKVFFVPFN